MSFLHYFISFWQCSGTFIFPLLVFPWNASSLKYGNTAKIQTGFLSFPLLCIVPIIIIIISDIHEIDRIFALKIGVQQKQRYLNWAQKYHQESNLILNALRMGYNLLKEGDNTCCLTMLLTFLKTLRLFFHPDQSYFSSTDFQNQIQFLIYLCDFALFGLGLSHRQH